MQGLFFERGELFRKGYAGSEHGFLPAASFIACSVSSVSLWAAAAPAGDSSPWEVLEPYARTRLNDWWDNEERSDDPGAIPVVMTPSRYGRRICTMPPGPGWFRIRASGARSNRGTSRFMMGTKGSRGAAGNVMLPENGGDHALNETAGRCGGPTTYSTQWATRSELKCGWV